jgi:hypothetical protein
MILAVSSLIFITLTMAYGIGYNRMTMQPEFFYAMDPSPDIFNPMEQYPDFCFIILFIGYYMAISLLIFFWFEYCKWKWMHIPVEYRIEYKKIKDKKEVLFAMNGRKH